MDVLRPLERRLIGMCLATVLPMFAHGAPRERFLAEGGCGSPQTMLEASQAGNAMFQQLLAAGMPWSDRALNDYVDRLGQKLARASGSRQVFAFHVLYNPAVNAQALPGGHIVINSGAVSVAESEAELAAVLCHEIAHENSCDGQTPGREGNFFELICSAPTVVLGGPAGIAITAGAAWAAAGERARVIRAQEERADRLAAQYLVRAGYDPHAVAQFFRRVEAEEPRSGAETGRLLATHPRPNDRRSKLDKVTADLPFQAVAPHDETEFLHMRQAVRDYDDMYSRLVNIRLPGRDAPVPVLSRRPSSVAEGPRP